MTMDEWMILKNLLKMDPEIEIAIKSYTAIIKERAKLAIRSKCEGCAREWASQKDHACLMEYEELMKQCIDDELHLLTGLDTLAIIVRMAKMAKQESYILKHPEWAIHMMRCVYMDKVKYELYEALENYDEIILIN